ncbi:MAG TPA: PIG-L family deacetylase [Acidobacteriaceae bacterium]|nr:PIG-L family deacetylase [Acidobacteriaceae bacterium]
MRLISAPCLLAGLCLSFALPGVAQSQTQAPAPFPPGDAATFARPIPTDRGAAAVQDSLRKLRTRASLALVTAHPDDEDGGMLAYESRYAGADTTLLTLNRGEGGQNAMSGSYWDELGLLRTQELLAADRYYGVHQYWTRVADFGFSKTLEEALGNWGHDRVLYDVVRVIRMTRPLVVTAVFAGAVSDGHGQHQVSGEMAQEAYKVAGDPNVFPDQIRAGLLPWSPLKVYARVPFARISSKGIYDYATDHWAPARFRNYVDGSWIEGAPSTTVKISEGGYDPLYGLSYFQVARQGLNEQKSQNGGVGLPLPGPVSTPYHLYGARVKTASQESGFFDGIDVSLEGIAGYAPEAQRPEWRTRLAALSATVDKACAAFSPDDPAKIAPLLAEGLKQTNELLGAIAASSLPAAVRYNMTHELAIKQRQFNDALAQALGLNVIATVAGSGAQRGGSEPQPTFQTAIPGQQFKVEVHFANQGSQPVTVEQVHLNTDGDQDWKITPIDHGGDVAPGEARTLALSVAVPPHPTLTRAYFSRPTLEQSYYNVDDPRYLNLSNAPYPLTAELAIRYDGVELHTANVVQTVHRVTGPGPILEPLLVAPSVSLWLSSSAGVLPLNSTSLRLEVTVHSNVKGPAKGAVHLELPPGWTSAPAAAEFSTALDGDEQNVSFEIHPKDVQAKPYAIQAVAEYNGERYSEGYRMVGYTGLRPYPYYRQATYQTSGVDVKTAPGLKIGYIMGTGDDVPRSLEDLGIHVDSLSAQDLATGRLSDYDALVVGIRAYAVRPELRTLNDRLLQYVKDGGVLLVQYQTPEFDHNYGPYPLSLGGNPEKVIDENSAVTLLHPGDPVLSWPNKITPADFSHWVEERGHDFAGEWNANYVALTETHDTGQDPQKGGILYAHYGKGLYVYTAYAFYRQLPEGVPGAFRIFANLLSLKKNPGLDPGK